jgi:hypothetical protein
VSNFAENLSNNDLINAIKEAWSTVPRDFLQSLIDSIEGRIA